MQPFAFHRPSTIAEAVSLLRGDAKAISGGQSFLPIMKEGLAAPDTVVSLRNIDDLKGIREEGGRLVIGAAETHASVNRSSEVQRLIPSLAALAGGIGDAQVRNRGTIGGSLAHADPAADYPAAALALDAVIHTTKREIPAASFFTGLFTTALTADELITKVSFTVPSRANYQKFPHPASKYAVVGVFVANLPAGPRVGVTGAAPYAARWVAAEQALAASWSADAVGSLQVPTGTLNEDPDFSAAYRAHLMAVLAKRAVGACG
ncbi:MAG: FAD binding domain-containing protein [Myxococcales bacterium]|nr:FAD binding domain-containing protein [Myxococcales bacterium]